MKNAFLHFNRATEKDSELLSNTAFQSKKHWKYSKEQMKLWKEELTISKSYVSENKVFIINDGQMYVGFIALVFKKDYIEIDHFWLVPEFIGKGMGTEIFRFIKKVGIENGYKFLQLTSEPHANGFYSKMGGKIIHSKESKIKNRFLCVFEFELSVSC